MSLHQQTFADPGGARLPDCKPAVYFQSCSMSTYMPSQLVSIVSNLSSTSLPSASMIGVESFDGVETKLVNVMAGLQLLLQQQAQMTRVMEDEHARDRVDMTQKQFENIHPVGRIFLGCITYLTTYFVLRDTTYRWEPGAQLSNGNLQHVHNHVREAVRRILACHSQNTFLRSLSVSRSSRPLGH